MKDRYHTPEELEKLIERLQDLIGEVIAYEYDYMTDEGKDALEEIADILNLNIDE